jgi:hypothetical protein
MTDPVTNNFSLVEPTVGGDTNTWGGILNAGVIAALDAVLGNNLAVTITTADVDLTTSQMQNKIFVLSGTLTGNRSLVIPISPNSSTVAVGGEFVIVNNTSGAYNVTVKTAASGSTGVTIPQGFVGSVYSDGTNVGYANNGLPAFALASNGNPNGQLAGTAGSVNTNATVAFDYANGILYVCTTTGSSSTAVWSSPSIIVPRGFDMPVNLGLAATHTGGNLLNLAIKQASGSDATALSPIIVNFQTVSGSNTTGLPTSVSIAGALSMTTNATGATMGTSNNTPFHVWFALFNNAGTAVPAMRVCSTAAGSIFPVAEYGVASTTAISGSATSAGVWYTPNGTALTNCAFRLIGYCEYTSGLATAGTYASDPNNTVLFGPGVKKPGDLVQRAYNSSTAASTGTAAGYTLNASTAPAPSNGAPVIAQAIVPTSAANLLRVRTQPWVAINGGVGTLGVVYLYNGTATVSSQILFATGAGGNNLATYNPLLQYSQVAGATSSITFTTYATENDGAQSIYINQTILGGGSPAQQVGASALSYIEIEEIMG